VILCHIINGSAMPTIATHIFITYVPAPPTLWVLQYLKQRTLIKIPATNPKNRSTNKGVGSVVAGVLHNWKLSRKLRAEITMTPKNPTKLNAKLAKSVIT
jgi:hypothetical protein